MTLALILSSHVAASRVGGGAQALALAAFGIDPVAVPTVLFGRHPGWGAPGGGAVADETFAGMLEGIAAHGVYGRADLVLTGYFASPGQVEAAAGAIDAVREASPRAMIVVDPVMGDDGKGLYVRPGVAKAIAALLVPRADLLAPNAWELGHLTGLTVTDAASAVTAARTLDRPVLVSSITHGEEIGVVYADAHEAWRVAHVRLASAPNGTGDLLTALFAAARLEGLPPSDALARSAGGLFATLSAATHGALPELPIVAMGAGLRQPSSHLRIERLS